MNRYEVTLISEIEGKVKHVVRARSKVQAIMRVEAAYPRNKTITLERNIGKIKNAV